MARNVWVISTTGNSGSLEALLAELLRSCKPLPEKGDVTVVEAEKPVVGDRHPVGIATEVLGHLV